MVEQVYTAIVYNCLIEQSLVISLIGRSLVIDETYTHISQYYFGLHNSDVLEVGCNKHSTRNTAY